MSLRVARGVYNPESERFHYYVAFKPTLDPTDEERDRGVERSYPVDVAISVTETGELADLAFTLPQNTRTRRTLEYIARTSAASVVEERGVEHRYPVDVAFSVTETGELAELAFSLPKPCCDQRSLLYLAKTDSASVVEEKVFVTVPGLSGDSVLKAKGDLELDAAGRIIGLEIN